MPEEFKSEQDVFSDTVREAVATIKTSLEEFSRAAAESRDTAASAVKKLGADTADQLGGISGEAKDRVSRGAENVAKQVSENPLQALAIAAGAGFLLGMVARGGPR